MTRISKIQYRPDSAQWFGNLRHLPYCAFIDSGHPSPFAGRYDILAAEPYITLTTRGAITEIRTAEGIEHSGEDPLTLLSQRLAPRIPADDGLPFTGGAIGSFAYDLGRRFERLPATAQRDIDFPEMLVGIYDWAFVVDHHQQAAYLVSAGRDPLTETRWPELLGLAEPTDRRQSLPFEVVSGIESNLTREAYAEAFTAVQNHIRHGDCYQVNLAQRFHAHVRGDSWQAYQALRKINPAPMAAFFGTPDGEILSSSPERFLRVDGNRIETKPIKGTRPRAPDAATDARLRDELAASAKDRAENVMIVDLLRNDIGKASTAGSVEVSKLYDIESFSQVHHMVSTVNGRLAPDRSALDLVRGCFPGGSITGAPKLRAMEIIESLEPERRSVYCGSLGYLGFDGRMDLNIAIRTLLRVGDSMYAWAGGGIVADSACAAEYQESLDKAAGLLAVLSRSSISATG